LKNTVFSIKLELKLLPLIVIVFPIPPNAGSIESMTGWAIVNDAINNIDDIYLNTFKSTKNYPTMCVGLDSFISINTTQSIGKILVAVGSFSPSNTLNSTLSS
jgi:hypothetical protein